MQTQHIKRQAALTTEGLQVNVSVCKGSFAYLDKSMEETQTKQQLLEGCRLLAAVEEGGIADRVIQVTLQQIGSQSLHSQMSLTPNAYVSMQEASLQNS